ncbi:MAG: hypothetical protein PF690_18765 [Deltaproteobacteria bacterium]|jgi:hypothetical protein|nr:hypothetical protein [Deltaproteobacteria bacterium]
MKEINQLEIFLNKMILPGKHTDIKIDSEPPALTTWPQGVKSPAEILSHNL